MRCDTRGSPHSKKEQAAERLLAFVFGELNRCIANCSSSACQRNAPVRRTHNRTNLKQKQRRAKQAQTSIRHWQLREPATSTVCPFSVEVSHRRQLCAVIAGIPERQQFRAGKFRNRTNKMQESVSHRTLQDRIQTKQTSKTAAPAVSEPNQIQAKIREVPRHAPSSKLALSGRGTTNDACIHAER